MKRHALLGAVLLTGTALAERTFPASPIPSCTPFYGRCIETLKIFGQASFKEASRDTVTASSLYHAPGVIVDRAAGPDRVYVADSGNNRILGFKSLGVCASDSARACTNDGDCASGDVCRVDPLKRADLIFGQPDSTSAACNGDDNLGIYTPPTARTLCLLDYPRASNTAEQWKRMNFDTDAQGNLFVPDLYNNRILVYLAPLGADTTGGKGDAVADRVLGQADFVSNAPNRGRGAEFPSADSISISESFPFTTTNGGPSVDSAGNVWVADTGNSRVLRFPPGASSANLVLGQSNFVSHVTTECSPWGPAAGQLNRLCAPTIARVDPVTGELYVVDESTPYGAFFARILVFTPPFTSGMSASRTVEPRIGGSIYTGPLYAGTGVFWPTYHLQVTGLAFNPHRSGAYADGVLWVTEHVANRALLLSGTGEVIAVVGARDHTLRGGDTEYGGACGSIYDNGNARAWWVGGALGIDDADNLYLADEMLFGNKVSRYRLPYLLRNVGGQTCLPDPDARLLRPDPPGAAKIGESVGMIAAGNQMILQDEARILAWNDPAQKPSGAPADVVVGQPSFDVRQANSFQLGARATFAVDHLNRLWTINAHRGLMVLPLPLTSATQPLVNCIYPQCDGGRVVWEDDGAWLAEGWTGIAIDRTRHKLWLADENRLVRISSYDDLSQPLRVDMVLGQTDKNSNTCNRGNPAPAANTLCEAHRIKMDHAGNLYVVENDYECHGNDRVVVYTAADLAAATGMFPNLSARVVFNRRLTSDFTLPPNCGVGPGDANRPFSPVTLAFNSRDELVIGNDGYYPDPRSRANKQLYLYRSPLTKQSPDFSIELPVGTVGDLDFDSGDRLIIQDSTWYRLWRIDPDEMDGGASKWLVALPCGAEVCDGLDNDCSGVADDGSDVDGDGVSVCDCAPADSGAYAVPGVVTGLTIEADKRTLHWVSAAATAGSGTVHDVLRGSVSELPVGAGPSETCLSAGQAAETLLDPVVPIERTAFWYLVRARNVCGRGTYGSRSAGTERISPACP